MKFVVSELYGEAVRFAESQEWDISNKVWIICRTSPPFSIRGFDKRPNDEVYFLPSWLNLPEDMRLEIMDRLKIMGFKRDDFIYINECDHLEIEQMDRIVTPDGIFTCFQCPDCGYHEDVVERPEPGKFDWGKMITTTTTNIPPDTIYTINSGSLKEMYDIWVKNSGTPFGKK